jgi:3-oxoacyl-[acyl-carrier-protein] synthase II
MNLDITSIDLNRIGVVLGTTYGNMNSLFFFDDEAYNSGVQFADPSLFPNTVVNSPTGHIAILFGFSGLNTTLSTGNASSLDALHYGIRSLLRGDADIVFAGGAEELSSYIHVSYQNGSYLSRSLNGSRKGPFDKKRDGFFLGEGACIIGLERLDHAEQRNVPILAEILGFGNGYGSDLSVPVETMSKALSGSINRTSTKMKPEEVSFISASGNGSVVGDKREGLALGEILGDRAKEMPITALKSMTGECCGASGALQVAQAALSLHHQSIPPTLNLDEIDPELPIRNVVRESSKLESEIAMINAFNDSGNHSTIVIKSY